MPGDNLTAIYSQIRQAAEVWNGVASSSLRLHFGGTRNMATPQTVPGIDVVFDDNIPPGIIAQTTLTLPSDLSSLSAQGTTFVPILRSKLQLRKDLTAAGYQQSSYTDAFFMTLVTSSVIRWVCSTPLLRLPCRRRSRVRVENPVLRLKKRIKLRHRIVSPHLCPECLIIENRQYRIRQLRIEPCPFRATTISRATSRPCNAQNTSTV